MLAAQMSDKALDLIVGYVLAGALATPNMGLFTGAPALSASTVLADLAALEPTFTGYARTAITPGALRRNANNDYIIPYSAPTFQPSAPTVGLPVTVTGYFVEIVISTVHYLWAAELFDSSYTFVDPLSALSPTYDFYIPNQRVYGGACSVC